MMLGVIEKYDQRFKQAGLKINPKLFVLIFYLTLIVLFILFINFKYGYILGPIFVIIYYYLIHIIINNEVKKE